MPSELEILEAFYKGIYGVHEGIINVSFKAIKDDEYGKRAYAREYYNWPQQCAEIVQRSFERRDSEEVYFSPSFYTQRSGFMEYVEGASVFWVELDNAPKEITTLTKPTLRIQSSTGKEHWYWQLDGFVDKDKLNSINKSLAYILGADPSGFDATQVLRPPATFNHKYLKTNPEPFPVSILLATGERLAPDVFDWLPPAPSAPASLTIEINNIPLVEDLFGKHKLPKLATDIFRTGVSSSDDRSNTLMQLGFELAKAGLPVEDMLSMLLNLDNRIGKFSKRDDQMKQLIHIASVAKTKYPDNGPEYVVKGLADFKIGYKSLINLEREIEWVIEGLLEEGGHGMVFGLPGTGKTQFTLQAAASIALGKDFLGFKVKRPRKLMYLSLEMSDLPIKTFVKKQSLVYTPEEIDMLEENLQIYPMGQPYHLNHKEQQDTISGIIREEGFEGVFIDSLSQSTDSSLIDDTAIRSIMGWVNKIRSRNDLFVFWIHHNRKATGENKKPNTVHDIFGSTFIGGAVTSAYCMWRPKGKHEVELYNVKARLSEEDDMLRIERDRETLFFTRTSNIAPGLIKADEQPTEANFAKFTEMRATRKLDI